MVDRKKASEKQEEEIIDRTAPPGEVVYEAVYAEGEHELERNSLELALSGLAAGLSMGFSMMTEGLLRHYMPQAHWAPLVSKLGYAIGFLIVILGRQQLFTKNTLTVILPLLREKKAALWGNVARLWIIVLAMNLLGAFLFAVFMGRSHVFGQDIRQVFAQMGHESMEPHFGTIVLRGILAGWLIALMVWLLPFAEAARTWVIIILAYVVGLAGLPHVVAGSVETFFLVSIGAASFAKVFTAYLIPALVGNVLGGVALVAVGAHAEFFEAEAQTS